MFYFNGKEEVTLDSENIPKHVAIIMDGNGRWAKKRFLPRKAGHKAGADALEGIIDAAKKIGRTHLTVYAFSTENWKRSQEEIDGIMDLLRSYVKKYTERAKKDNVKMDAIGDITRLDEDIQESIKNLEEVTKDKDALNLHIALNYGGRDELRRCVKKICKDVENGKISSDDIDEDIISKNLDTADIPDPELIIRTSGEERISNFLLWQIAYSEFCFSDKLWPDFKEEDLVEAVYQYQNRNRRFGGR